MTEDLIQLLERAIYREIASEALYSASQSKTNDPAAKTLLRELAEEESKHTQHLKNLMESPEKLSCYPELIPDLKISNYLVAPEKLDGAGLQETLLFAMKREQESLEFYSKLMDTLRDETAKCLCQTLVNEELNHKLKLELLYDSLFYKED